MPQRATGSLRVRKAFPFTKFTSLSLLPYGHEQIISISVMLQNVTTQRDSLFDIA